MRVYISGIKSWKSRSGNDLMNGNIALPFIFDDIEFIDNKYIFAKYNGKYGILDVEKTSLAIVGKAPATGRNSAVYIIILLFASAILVNYKNRRKINYDVR
jgi:hypothetical protein